MSTTAVIEYEWKAYSPPDDSHAWDIQARITHAAGIVTSTMSGLLADIRTELEESGLEPHGTVPIRQRNYGRWCPTWREVWKGKRERFPGKTEKKGERMKEDRATSQLMEWANRARTKYPQLNTRPANAVELVRRGHVQRTGRDTFDVKSQSSQTVYQVNVEARTCTCYDYHHNAPFVCDGPLCKHRLAALMWMQWQDWCREQSHRQARLLQWQTEACLAGHPVFLTN